MKNKKLKSLDKSARKEIRTTIESSLIADLVTLTGELGPASKKLDKEIKKGSKKLAKKLTKEIKVRTSAAPEMNAAPIAQAPVKAVVSVSGKPAVKVVKPAAPKTPPQKAK